MEYEVITERSIKFNGRKYSLKENGYYYNCTTRRHLHQAVWEYHNGPIPDGYQIHHIDFNKENNDISNLACLSVKEHAAIHKDALTDGQRQWKRDNLRENALPKATEWHKSEEGREWHRQHAKKMAEDGTSAFTKIVTLTCDNCGKQYEGKNTNHHGHHFCSNNCKSAFRRASGVDDVETVCPACGKTFKMNKYDLRRRSGTAACSISCANVIKWREGKMK